MRWPDSNWPTPAGPDPTPAREGQIQYDTRGQHRSAHIAGPVAVRRGHEFRPYRWMDPAREHARRALPAGLRKILESRAGTTEHTTAA